MPSVALDSVKYGSGHFKSRVAGGSFSSKISAGRAWWLQLTLYTRRYLSEPLQEAKKN